MKQEAFHDVIDSQIMPKVIKLSDNLICAHFSLMKLLPAYHLIQKALKDSLIDKNTIILETTSGTFGLGLAIVCNKLGLKCKLVSDPVIDMHIKKKLDDLGCEVEIVYAENQIQLARLARLQELRQKYKNHYWPNQYNNPENRKSYLRFVHYLIAHVGKIDCLIGPVGSGGSMSGTTHYLRQIFPQMQAIAVDTHGSILFGDQDKPRVLRGLGNSIIPYNLIHRSFDSVHWVNAAEAFHSTRSLYKKHAIFAGPTSGASYLVADWWSKQNVNKNCIVIFPDDGHRYIDTVFDNNWLEQQKLKLDILPNAPEQISHIEEKQHQWSFMHWNRRELWNNSSGDKHE